MYPSSASDYLVAYPYGETMNWYIFAFVIVIIVAFVLYCASKTGRKEPTHADFHAGTLGRLQVEADKLNDQLAEMVADEKKSGTVLNRDRRKVER